MNCVDGAFTNVASHDRAAMTCMLTMVSVFYRNDPGNTNAWNWLGMFPTREQSVDALMAVHPYPQQCAWHDVHITDEACYCTESKCDACGFSQSATTEHSDF